MPWLVEEDSEFSSSQVLVQTPPLLVDISSEPLYLGVAVMTWWRDGELLTLEWIFGTNILTLKRSARGRQCRRRPCHDAVNSLQMLRTGFFKCLAEELWDYRNPKFQRKLKDYRVLSNNHHAIAHAETTARNKHCNWNHLQVTHSFRFDVLSTECCRFYSQYFHLWWHDCCQC